MNADRDRDRAMDELLRRAVRGDAAATQTNACLDAETIAAWVDGGLDAHALAMAESHVSGCARCQAIVGAMVRTTAAAPAPASWWQRDWGMRWLVPLAAGAAAVVLWMVVPGQQRPAVPAAQPESMQARADAAETAAPAPVAPAPAEAVMPPAAQPALRVREAEQAPAVKPQPAAAPVAPREAEPAPARKQQAVPPESARDKDVAVAPAQVATESKLEAQIAAESPAKRSEERVATAPPAPPVAAPPAPAADAAKPAAALGRMSQDRVSQNAATREIVSPDPAVRWRLGARGAVEYSANGGSAWEALSTGVAAELTAGSSPSPAVCWLVGRGGVIFLTTDGRRWQRVPFPESADLSSVDATDARAAVVTTADGRTFRTADAGVTWIRP